MERCSLPFNNFIENRVTSSSMFVAHIRINLTPTHLPKKKQLMTSASAGNLFFYGTIKRAVRGICDAVMSAKVRC